MLRSRPAKYHDGIERTLASLDDSFVEEIPVTTYTDVSPLFKGGRHVLLAGRTGSGKTTLLLTLLRDLYESGHMILHRDDGGLEFLYLLPEIPMTVFIPEGCEFRVDGNYKLDVIHFEKPYEVVDQVYDTKYPFNVVVYDVYCLHPEWSAQFYCDLFKALIHKCMNTPRDLKERLVFSIDELNDLIQPRGMSLTPQHAKVRALIEYNIRKLRKHLVTLIATAHRLNMLGINVRSQFSYVFLKQSFGWDVYDFINKSLITADNRIFWSILKDITTLPVNYFYLFDYKNNYDKIRYRDIRRPKIAYETQGSVQEVEEEEESREVTQLKRIIAIEHLRRLGFSLNRIGEIYGCKSPYVSMNSRRAEEITREFLRKRGVDYDRLLEEARWEED